MKNIFTLIFIAISLTIFARLGYPQQSQQSSAQTITLTATTPPTIQNVSANRSGAPGNSIYYYTVIANYPRGQSNFSRQAIINNAPDTLTGSNFITINWSPVSAPTPSASITYDVLRTLTPSIPVPCTCAVATGLTSPTFINNSTTINSYTLSPVPNATAHITLDNISRSNARIIIDTPMNNPIIGTNTIGAGANILPTTGIQVGSLTVVSDGSSTSDCTVGGGTSFALCMWNGSAWTGIGGGGGGGLADPGGNGIVVRTALNVTTNRSLAAGTGVIITNADGTAGNPTAAIDPAVVSTNANLQATGASKCNSTVGSGSAYVCAMNPVVSTCTEGMKVFLTVDTNSVSGGVSLNNGCGVHSIKRFDHTTDPFASEIVTGSQGTWLTYDLADTVWLLPYINFTNLFPTQPPTASASLANVMLGLVPANGNTNGTYLNMHGANNYAGDYWSVESNNTRRIRVTRSDAADNTYLSFGSAGAAGTILSNTDTPAFTFGRFDGISQGTITSLMGIQFSGDNGVTFPAAISFLGLITGTQYATKTNCSSSASPAVCGSAAAGSVVVAAGATTVVVNTTAVTANSQIFLEYDSSLGTKLSVTCNVTEPALYGVTARTGGTSFTITSSSPAANPACFSYFIVN